MTTIVRRYRYEWSPHTVPIALVTVSEHHLCSFVFATHIAGCVYMTKMLNIESLLEDSLLTDISAI